MAVGLLPEELRAAVSRQRCVTVVGLPGMGKSLCVRELATLASQRGQQVHLLQWDVARLAWDTAEILAQYPEIGGITHVVIRKATALWVRRAVEHWFEQHGPAHQLIIEAPLIGGRFTALAADIHDAAEVYLRGDQSLFLVMLPTAAVQQQLRQRRGLQLAHSAHALDQHNASLAVLDAQLQVIRMAAAQLGLPTGAAHGYSPEVYAGVMRAVLRHRRVRWLKQQTLIDTTGSVYDLPGGVQRLEADAADVAATLKAASMIDPGALRIEVDERWALT